MFKRIRIELTGPICNCPEQKLAWAVPHDHNGKSILKVFCETCGTTLLIPNEKFVACFALDQAYPGNPQEQPKHDEPKPNPGQGDGTQDQPKLVN